MAARKAAGRPASPMRGYKLMIGFGLVNVGVKYAPAARGGRTYAKTLCSVHGTPIKQASTCEQCDGICETKKGYEYGGNYVEVDTDAIRLDRDGRFEIDAALPAGGFDEYRIEKSYLLWPQEGFDPQFALLIAALRDTGKSLVGTSVMAKSTKSLVLRWSDDLQIPVLHVCIYDAQVAWNDVELVRELLDSVPAAGKQESAMATLLVDSLPASYAWSEVADEYETALAAALEAAASGKVIAPTGKPQPTATPAVDLMAVLRESLAANGQPPTGKQAKKPVAKRKLAA